MPRRTNLRRRGDLGCDRGPAENDRGHHFGVPLIARGVVAASMCPAVDLFVFDRFDGVTQDVRQFVHDVMRLMQERRFPLKENDVSLAVQQRHPEKTGRRKRCGLQLDRQSHSFTDPPHEIIAIEFGAYTQPPQQPSSGGSDPSTSPQCRIGRNIDQRRTPVRRCHPRRIHGAPLGRHPPIGGISDLKNCGRSVFCQRWRIRGKSSSLPEGSNEIVDDLEVIVTDSGKSIRRCLQSRIRL